MDSGVDKEQGNFVIQLLGQKGEICREGEEIITFFYISPDWRPERKADMFSTCLEKIIKHKVSFYKLFCRAYNTLHNLF